MMAIVHATIDEHSHSHIVLLILLFAVQSSDEAGFFSNVGPLRLFVSRFCMPEDMLFNDAMGDSWVSTDGSVEIREGSIVRLRVLGVVLDGGHMKAIGTIKESYLGQLEV